MKISRSALVIVLGSLAFAPVAMADSASDDLTVHAEVLDGCIISGADLDFGIYDTVAGAENLGTASLTVACTTGSQNMITLGQGDHADGGSTPDAPLRRLGNGGSFLSYSLYSDAGYSDTWGDTAASGLAYAAASAAPSFQPVFGRLHAGQDVPAGIYSDTVLATISF